MFGSVFMFYWHYAAACEAHCVGYDSLRNQFLSSPQLNPQFLLSPHNMLNH